MKTCHRSLNQSDTIKYVFTVGEAGREGNAFSCVCLLTRGWGKGGDSHVTIAQLFRLVHLGTFHGPTPLALPPGDSTQDVLEDPAARNNEGCKSTPVQKKSRHWCKGVQMFGQESALEKVKNRSNTAMIVNIVFILFVLTIFRRTQAAIIQSNQMILCLYSWSLMCFIIYFEFFLF